MLVAAPSAITKCSISSCASSQAVKRPPCSNGLVSSANTCFKIPLEFISLITPSAVPQVVVAKDPVLQCVSALIGLFLTFDSIQLEPNFPICLLPASSSKAILFACAKTSLTPCATNGKTLSTPQAKLTAVGLAFLILKNSSDRFCSLHFSFSAWRIATTTPHAPAAPNAGAPRTANFIMASTS